MMLDGKKARKYLKYFLFFTQEATDDNCTTEECIWKQPNATLVWLIELQTPSPSLPSNLLKSG